MLRGLKEDSKRSKFKYYLRQCKECCEIFKASSKGKRVCPECKPKLDKLRNQAILKAKGLLQDIEKEVIKNYEYRTPNIK